MRHIRTLSSPITHKNDKGDNIKKMKMRRAKKLLRGAQRRANASKKKNFMEKVMKASSILINFFTNESEIKEKHPEQIQVL